MKYTLYISKNGTPEDVKTWNGKPTQEDLARLKAKYPGCQILVKAGGYKNPME